MQTPTEADFEVTQNDPSQIEVTFKPTQSIYTFSRDPSGKCTGQVKLRHASGDTGGHPSNELLGMAWRTAERAAQASVASQ